LTVFIVRESFNFLKPLQIKKGQRNLVVSWLNPTKARLTRRGFLTHEVVKKIENSKNLKMHVEVLKMSRNN